MEKKTFSTQSMITVRSGAETLGAEENGCWSRIVGESAGGASPFWRRGGVCGDASKAANTDCQALRANRWELFGVNRRAYPVSARLAGCHRAFEAIGPEPST